MLSLWNPILHPYGAGTDGGSDGDGTVYGLETSWYTGVGPSYYGTFGSYTGTEHSSSQGYGTGEHSSSHGDSVMISTGGGVYITTCCCGEALSQQHGHSQHPSSPHSA